MYQFRFHVLIVCLASLLICGLARAAEGDKPATPADKGSISGTVKDSQGNPAADATVMLNAAQKNTDANKPPTTRPTVKTDAEGKFAFKDVPAGEYNISARIKRQLGGAQVTVVAGQETTVDLALQAALMR